LFTKSDFDKVKTEFQGVFPSNWELNLPLLPHV